MVKESHTNQRQQRMLRIAGVEELTGLKKTTIYRLVREQRFPAPVRLSHRCSAWQESAVCEWLEERINGGQA